MSLDRKGEILKGELPATNKGLVRLRDGGWLHFSRKRDTVKLREVTPDEVKPEETFDVSDPARLAAVVERVSGALFYAGWPKESAVEGRARLATRRRRSPVPQTKLRGLYDVLCEFKDSTVGAAILKNALRKKGRPLLKYFDESYEHFDHYRNLAEGFGDGKNRKKEEASKYAERLARTLQASGQWTGDPHFAFDFVAREVDFRRTSGGAFFEDGTLASSSSRGGVDLLLRSHAGGLPIVGEIKASTDTNAFVALVQALTYACELVTPAQRERVERHYPEHFSAGLLTSNEGPHADIYLICEGQAALSDETAELARHLLADRERCLGRSIRRIVCLQTPPHGGPEDLAREWVVA